jgi:hypothetical protein
MPARDAAHERKVAAAKRAEDGSHCSLSLNYRGLQSRACVREERLGRPIHLPFLGVRRGDLWPPEPLCASAGGMLRKPTNLMNGASSRRRASMAILKGVKIRKGETFADGFREGYKSIIGNDAAIPTIPDHSIPDGKLAYLWGKATGIGTALRRRERESPSSSRTA